MSKDLFIPADFDAIYPFIRVSDNPRHNVLVFDYIRDFCRVAKLVIRYFPTCLDDVYNIQRPSVAIDSFFSDKLCTLSICMFDLTALACVDIKDHYDTCLYHWSGVYHDILRIACSCPVVYFHLALVDRDYLDDACFPWYLRIKENLGIPVFNCDDSDSGSCVPVFDGDDLPY